MFLTLSLFALNTEPKHFRVLLLKQDLFYDNGIFYYRCQYFSKFAVCGIEDRFGKLGYFQARSYPCGKPIKNASERLNGFS
jgi:hypothetical protein